MWTITLASQKGGTGKSTLAIGLAVSAMEDGERVCMLETDPQGTSSNWGKRRANPEPAVERIADRFQLERTLRMLVRGSYTLAIIDTPGSDNDIANAAIRLADLCLIPVRPSLADMRQRIRRLRRSIGSIRHLPLCSTKGPCAASVRPTSPQA